MTGLWQPPAGKIVYTPSGDGEYSALEVREVLAEGRSDFQDYAIVETTAFGRALILDANIQSCQYDEWIYHEAFVTPAMCAVESPRCVAVLGGGEGAMLREVLRHDTVESVVMVDIDGEVVEACKKHLECYHQGAFDDPRVELVIDDARTWLEKTAPQGFDVVLIDLTEPLAGGPSWKLFTREFYELVRASMKPGGVAALQAGALRPDSVWATGRVKATLDHVLGHTLPYGCWVTSFFEQWGFILAGQNPDTVAISPALLAARLSERKVIQRFLDGEAFSGMTGLGKHIRDELASATALITDAEPLIKRFE